MRKDPWEESCERDDGFTCLTGRKGRCKRPNSTYRIAEENLMGEGKVRYIEQRGRTIESQLVRKHPWEESCEREDCFTCLTGRKGRCQRPNSTYRIDCKACEEKGRKATYFGETARCSYDRGREHLKALRENYPNSVLVQHQEESHPGEAPDYQMKVVNHQNKTMLRQIHESILIEGFTGSGLLNRRGECWSNLPPKAGSRI